jgi:hypothetical protein
MKVLKFTLPTTDQVLYTELNETKQNVFDNYIGGDDGMYAVEDIQVEEVEMTQEAFDALPEFEG